MSAPFFRTDFSTVPALPMALSTAAGAALFFSAAGLWKGPGGVLFTLLVMPVLCALSTPSVTRRCLFALALGVTVGGLHWLRVSNTFDQLLPRHRPAGAEIEGVVTEALGRTGADSWFVLPNRIRVEVQRLRTGGAWRDCSGRTLITLPADRLWMYGERFHASGAFLLPEAPRFPGGYNEQRYLASRGITHRFRAVEMTPLGPAGGRFAWGRLVYQWRDRWLRAATAGLKPANASLLAAFTAGYRYGLSPETMATFLRSGTIHVFAISGLHIGIVAAIFSGGLLLLRIPFRLRHAMLPLLLGGYVFITGGAPSATRAWLMISVYCLARALYRPVQPLQAVSLAALVLLVWNPLHLLAPGFQFSFVIVAFLLVGWQQWMPALRSLFEKDFWKPEEYRQPRWMRRAQYRGTQLFCAGILAWLGSAGLVLCANALFIPATVPVNIGISLVLMPAFVLALVKTGLTALGVGALGAPLADCLDVLIGGIRRLALAGSRPPASLAVWQPGLLLGFAYYALAICLLLAPSRRLRMSALGALVLLFAAVFSVPALKTPRATVFHGAGLGTPAVAVFAGGSAGPTVINSGGYAWSRSLRTYLRSRGCNRIGSLVICSGRQDSQYGAEQLIQVYRPASLYLPAGRTSPRGRRELESLAQLQQARGGRVRWFGQADEASEPDDSEIGAAPMLQVSVRRPRDGRETRIRRRHSRHSWILSLTNKRSGSTDLQLRFRPGRSRRLSLPRSRRPQIHSLRPSP